MPLFKEKSLKRGTSSKKEFYEEGRILEEEEIGEFYEEGRILEEEEHTKRRNLRRRKNP